MYMGNVCEGDKCVFPQVDDVEIAVSLALLPAALRDVNQIMKATKICFPVFGLYIRFGLKSESFLGPTANGDVAFVEIHILRTRDGTPHVGFAAVDEIRQLLLNKYKGQPHWGKNFASDFNAWCKSKEQGIDLILMESFRTIFCGGQIVDSEMY